MDWGQKKYTAGDIVFWTSTLSTGIFLVGNVVGYFFGYDKGIEITQAAVKANLMEAVASGRIAPGPGADDALKVAITEAKRLQGLAMSMYAAHLATLLEPKSY